MEEEPVTFLKALQEKYSDEEYQLLFAGLISHEKQKEEENKNSPGLSKRFAFPPCVVLQNFGISFVEPCHQLFDWCMHLTEIDLSFNRLDNWNAVCPLMQSIPALESLNLSFNPLKKIKLEHLPTHPVSESIFSKQLKRLVLNGTEIDSKVVFGLLQLLPGVEELHLSLNGYSAFPEELAKENWPGKGRNNIKTLYIDSNNLAQWDSILVIGSVFPYLQTLFASHNPLRDLHIADPESLQTSFPHLRKLHVNQIELSHWNTLDQLNHLSELKDLRLLGCSLCSDEAPNGSSKISSSQNLPSRQQVIARLPKLQTLNGTPIDPIERMDAERSFLRFYHQSDPLPRRYQELVGKHGQLTPLLEVELRAPRLVNVSLTYGDVKQRPYKLDVRQSVGQLKKSLAPVTGLSPTKCRIFYVDSEMVSVVGADELKLPGRALHSYSIKTGDELIIEPK